METITSAQTPENLLNIELTDYFSPELFQRFNIMQGARFITKKIKKKYKSMTTNTPGHRGRAASRITLLKRSLDCMAIGDEITLRNSDRRDLERHIKVCGRAPYYYKFAVGYVHPDHWVDPTISECRLSRTR